MSKNRTGSTATISKTTLSDKRAESTLSAIEEKALRMRQGRSLRSDAPLGLKAEAGSEAAEQLALIEAKLIQAWRRRQEGLDPSQVTVRDAETSIDSLTQRKILRGLRNK